MIIENIEDFSPCINCQTKECGLVDGNECDRCNEFFKLKRTIEQAKMVVHAHWWHIELFRDLDNKDFIGVECSNCHNRLSDESFDDPMDFEFCPHCGARMDGNAK